MVPPASQEHAAAGPARQNDPVTWLRASGVSTTLRLKKREALFYQAMPADCVFYLLKGRIKLATVSPEGKEATIALLRPGDFLGEECVAQGRHLRTTAAIAISECALLRTERAAMIELLRSHPQFFNLFLSFVVSRNVRMQEDLVDRLFHNSEKRLARVLLLLASFDDPAQSEIRIPKVSQETLAEIVGTTRSRVSFFMNSFRKRGLIDYDGHYRGSFLVRNSLREVLSGDK
ncbi:MAG TPA: Crp/Fnr family transcriptional regulator [Candidatus Angelobacter sp.]|nr:Crp/Fnr family transcriptional regulator [Candidatus Angelobacter sp.]